jgi:hypothetical protein
VVPRWNFPRTCLVLWNPITQRETIWSEVTFLGLEIGSHLSNSASFRHALLSVQQLFNNYIRFMPSNVPLVMYKEWRTWYEVVEVRTLLLWLAMGCKARVRFQAGRNSSFANASRSDLRHTVAHFCLKDAELRGLNVHVITPPCLLYAFITW